MVNHSSLQTRALLARLGVKVSAVLLVLSALSLLAPLPTFAATTTVTLPRSPHLGDHINGVTPLNGSSFFAPGATANCQGDHSPQSDLGDIVVAWTDFNHHLNVAASLDISNAPQNYQTFGDTSTDGPSIVCWHNKFFLAWTANDSSHRLFVAQWDGGTDNTLSNRVTVNTDTSLLTPTLAVSGDVLYLAWKGLTNKNIFIASSGDGKTWSQAVGLTDTTVAPPALADYNGQLYVAWAGTDNPSTLWFGAYNGTSHLLHHGHFAQATDVRPGLISFNNKLFISWVGSDSRLNVGVSTDGLSFQYLYTRSDTTFNDLSMCLWTNPPPNGVTGLALAWTGTNANSTIYYDITSGR